MWIHVFQFVYVSLTMRIDNRILGDVRSKIYVGFKKSGLGVGLRSGGEMEIVVTSVRQVHCRPDYFILWWMDRTTIKWRRGQLFNPSMC